MFPFGHFPSTDPLTLLCLNVIKLLQSCPILDDPMDYSPPGSSVHGTGNKEPAVFTVIGVELNLFPPLASLVAKRLKHLPPMQETQV